MWLNVIPRCQCRHGIGSFMYDQMSNTSRATVARRRVRLSRGLQTGVRLSLSNGRRTWPSLGLHAPETCWTISASLEFEGWGLGSLSGIVAKSLLVSDLLLYGHPRGGRLVQAEQGLLRTFISRARYRTESRGEPHRPYSERCRAIGFASHRRPGTCGCRLCGVG